SEMLVEALWLGTETHLAPCMQNFPEYINNFLVLRTDMADESVRGAAGEINGPAVMVQLRLREPEATGP
ncbi:hypothetical protein Tco_1128001, partial [Tanacetum coccineum]